MHALNIGKDRKSVLNKEPLLSQTHPSRKSEDKHPDFVELTVTFVDPKSPAAGTADEKMLEGVPTVRIIFNEEE